MQAIAAGKAAATLAAGIFLVEMLSCFAAFTHPVDYPTTGCSRGKTARVCFIWGCRMQNKLLVIQPGPKGSACLTVTVIVMVDIIIHH